AYSLTIKPNGNASFGLNTEASAVSSSSAVPLNGWHHVAGTYDRTAGVQKLFIDGTEVASEAYSGAISVNALPLYIGRYHSDSRTFNGKLDEVRVYNRALTAAEISDLAAGED
ncbi:MAG: LamG domain-containing protein, partial [Candidatus Binatia bacterium]